MAVAAVAPPMPAPTTRTPLLSICVPTYARPTLLHRVLRSVVDQAALGEAAAAAAARVEILVSDNSPDVSERVAREVLADWPGPTTYLPHRPNVGMVGNFNACVDAARGQWILILHDDDLLLEGAVERLVASLDRNGPPVRLFGVDVVDGDGNLVRRQAGRERVVLEPHDALRALMTNSSFVREPGAVVRREAYAAVGRFRDGLGGADDFEMWIRLFAPFGVGLEPDTTAGYTVHDDADTTAMFHAGTIRILLGLFEEARATRILSDRELSRARAAWFHQFVLGGTFRQLRAGRRDEARRVYALLRLPELRALGRPPLKWSLVRRAIGTILRLPDRLWPGIAQVAGDLAPVLRVRP